MQKGTLMPDSRSKTTSVRIKPALVSRVERVAKTLSELVGGEFGNSSVIGRAYELGLPLLEAKLGIVPDSAKEPEAA